MDDSGKIIDLHVHSSASDGSEPAERIPFLAKEIGLSAVALTDHDTVSGIPAFMEAGLAAGIETIPGVEISTRLFKKELHIVGLFIDIENPDLLALMKRMRDARDERNQLIVQRLNTLGYAVQYQELLDRAGGESIGRPHIAQVLVEKGYADSFQDAFERFLKRGCQAYVPRMLPDARDAVPVIRKAGGVSIWAHALSGQSGARSFARKMLHALCGFGLDGVEAYYTMFSPKDTELMLELAGMFHLCCSGGSDFHGSRQPGIALGSGAGKLCVPASLLDGLKLRREENQRLS